MSIIEPQPQSSSEQPTTTEHPENGTKPAPHRSVQIIVASIRFILPIAVLLIAIFVAIALVNTRPMVPRLESGQRATLVETVTPATRNARITISGYGTVEPFQRVRVQPQVGGLVTDIDPALVPGGLISQDALIFQIDPREYELIVEQRRADVADARVALQIAEAGKLVAEREWELLGGTIETTELGEQLARKEPQMREAQAKLAAAESRRQLAELDLARTKVTAPFNGLVIEEAVEVGQVISPLSPVATLVGTDAFEIVASIPIEKLDQIRIDPANPQQNSMATVSLELGEGRMATRQARVARIGGEVERAGRLAKVILKVTDPLALHEQGERLLLGSYVRVDIEGPEVADVMELPRYLLHENNTIWVLTTSNTLDIRSIDIVSGREGSVLARAALEPGESIITSPLPVAIPGMPLERFDAPGTTTTGNQQP